MAEDKKNKEILSAYQHILENEIHIVPECIGEWNEVQECVIAFGIECLFDDDVSSKLAGIRTLNKLNEDAINNPIDIWGGGRHREEPSVEEFKKYLSELEDSFLVSELEIASARSGEEDKRYARQLNWEIDRRTPSKLNEAVEPIKKDDEDAPDEDDKADDEDGKSDDEDGKSDEDGATDEEGNSDEVLDSVLNEPNEEEAEREKQLEKEKEALSVEDQNKLLTTLEQVNKNILKMDGLEDKKELRDIYLQEVGKKHLIETKLQDSGYVFDDVEDIVDKLFESIILNGKKVININESKKNYLDRFKMSDMSESFKRSLSSVVKRSLSESSVVLNTGNRETEICDSDLDNVDDIISPMIEDYVPDLFIINAGDGFYICDDGEMSLGLTDDVSKAFVFDANYESADDALSLAETIVGFECTKEAVQANDPKHESFHRLTRDFTCNNNTLVRTGTPVQLYNGVYTFDNDSGEQVKITNNPDFSSMLIDISEQEYQLSLSDIAMKNSSES